eukprot:352953-Chlamydomonas_euryale.AAC.8
MHVARGGTTPTAPPRGRQAAHRPQIHLGSSSVALRRTGSPPSSNPPGEQFSSVVRGIDGVVGAGMLWMRRTGRPLSSTPLAQQSCGIVRGVGVVVGAGMLWMRRTGRPLSSNPLVEQSGGTVRGVGVVVGAGCRVGRSPPFLGPASRGPALFPPVLPHTALFPPVLPTHKALLPAPHTAPHRCALGHATPSGSPPPFPPAHPGPLQPPPAPHTARHRCALGHTAHALLGAPHGCRRLRRLSEVGTLLQRPAAVGPRPASVGRVGTRACGARGGRQHSSSGQVFGGCAWRSKDPLNGWLDGCFGRWVGACVDE